MRRSALLLLLYVLMAGSVLGAENASPALKAKPGEMIDVPVLVEKAENLAGVKLVIAYDKELLIFKEGNASKIARSLMCVINDKNPGRLIIVMAGAKGISGKDLPLLTLTFEIKKDLPGAHTLRLDLLENQLMSDQLKELKSKVIIKPLDIVP